MRAKRILQVLAAVAGVLALAVAALLNPGLQTWAARKVIDSAQGSGVSVGHVSVGFGGADAEGLRVEREGMVLAAPTAHAEIGVISACLGRGWHFQTLVAKGWTLDLTRGGGAAPSQAEVAGPWAARAVGGLASAFRLPANLTLDGVDLEGDILFPGADGQSAGKVHVVVTGGGLASGREGKFLCRASAVLDDSMAPVSRVMVNAVLIATTEAAGTLARAELKADAVASGRGIPSGIGLSFTASTAHGAGKRAYSVALTRGSDLIAAVDLQNPDGSQNISGTWRLDLRDTDLAPFALGRSLPAFYVAGSGSIEADAASGDLHAAGKLQATADRLGVLAKGLAPLGHVNLAADFDVARLGASLRVARLNTSLAGTAPVASVRALQSFEFNTSTGELKVAVPSGDLVGISVTGIPLSWLRAGYAGVGFTGEDARGEFVMRAEDGRLALRTKAPLTAQAVTLASQAGVIASGLELSAFVLADLAPQGWQVQLAPLAVRKDGIRMLSLEARFGRLSGAGKAIKAAGSWSASLPALLSVPAAAGLPRLSGGEASGSFEASLDSTSEVRLKLAVKDLALASGAGAKFPSIDSEVRADFEAGGRTTFSIPLRLDYGSRTAQIAVTGTVARGPKGAFIDAALEGSRITGDDLVGISLLSGAGQAGSAQPGAGPQAPGPFWPPVHGKFTLRLEAISLRRFEIRDVRGVLRIEPGALAIEGGTASLVGGGAARASGEVVFLPGAARPLSLKADLSVDNVESAPLFRTMDPSRLAAIDGRFDIVSHLTGRGLDAADLLERVQGDFRLSSKDGRFRALHADIIDSIRQAPSKLVDALDTVSSLFGRKTDKIGQALVESANGISEIHYDQMDVTAERGPDLDLRMTGISMIAPEARLTGTGRIAYAAGVLLQDQPLSVELNLGVRGRLGNFLDVVGLLSDGQDELGYTRLNQPIHLGGTLRAIDQSQWKDMLVQASLRKGGGLFDKLLGR